MSNGIDKDEVRSRAHGQWGTIIPAVAGCDSSFFDGKNHPCPKERAGKDRFRFTDMEGNGSAFCNQCGRDLGDGFAVIMWLLDIGFGDSLKLVAEYLGITSSKAGKSAEKPIASKSEAKKTSDPFESKFGRFDRRMHDYNKLFGIFATSKPPITVEAIEASGAYICTWPVSNNHGKKCIGWPAYNSPEEITGHILRRLDGKEFDEFGNLAARKTHMLKGSKDGWVIPGGFDRVAAASVVWRVEGVPDALSLFPFLPSDHAVVTNICGAGSVKDLNLEILRGKVVYSVGDADEPGQAGAEKFAASVASIADEVRIVKLPFEIDETHGRDVRDYFAEGGKFEYLLKLASDSAVIEKTEQKAEESDITTLQASLKSFTDAISSRIDAGRDPYETLKEIKDQLKRIEATIAVDEFIVMTSAELDAANLKTEYLIEGVFAKNQPCILAASKKSLKTTIAIEMTLSLASGAKFLNQFYVPRQVRVALMSGESGDAVIQETARRIARSKPWISLGDYENALWSFSLPKIGQPQTRATLKKFIETHKLEVLIIDPAYLCLELGDDAGNLFTVGPKLLELSEIGRETDCTMVIIHHNRKSPKENPFAPPELESIAWSGFQEWARQWILLNRREAYNPEKAGTHKLWLSVGGSAGHSGLWGMDAEEGSIQDPSGRRWEVAVDVASAVISETVEKRETEKEEKARVRQEKQVAKDAERLLREIQKTPAGDTVKAFRERISMSGSRAALAIEKLLEEGKIESCEVPKGNRQWPGLRLSQQAPGPSGTDRDSTGTNSASPDDSPGPGQLPLRGCPESRSSDTREFLFEDAAGNSPDAAGVNAA